MPFSKSGSVTISINPIPATDKDNIKDNIKLKSDFSLSTCGLNDSHDIFLIHKWPIFLSFLHVQQTLQSDKSMLYDPTGKSIRIKLYVFDSVITGKFNIQ